MYNQNIRNQVVKEIKNGSTVASTAMKFSVSNSTITNWIKEYDEKMYEMMRDNAEERAPVIKPIAAGIKLKSVKVLISGAVVTLKRSDVLKMLKLFNIFDERAEGE